MNACSLHTPVPWFAVLLLISSLSVLYAQESTNDPFLDAMLKDSSPAPATETVTTAPEQEKPTSTPVQQTSDQPVGVQSHLINTSTDTQLIDQTAVMRELGESTGLGIFNDATAYEGKTVTGVSIRYISGKQTVPDQRLLDVIQTAPGTKYVSSRVNDDLERLLEKGWLEIMRGWQ